MLMWLTTEEDVGTYAVAAQLSDLWAFVPAAIVASVFPALVKLRDENDTKYTARMQQIFDLLAFLAFGLAIATTLIASPLIRILYGEEYLTSADILIVHIWCNVFVFLRALFSRWIHLEQVFIFSIITQGVGAVSNVLLNLWLIPQYAGYGAAIATIISYGLASIGTLVFYEKTRSVFYMMSKALLFPVRLPFILKNLRT